MASGKRTRIVGVVGACLAVSALLAACGDDDDDAASDTTIGGCFRSCRGH